MYYNAFFVPVMFASIALAANDQDYWIKQAEKNAKKNLDQWPLAVNSFVFGNDSKLVQDEIVFLQAQVSDSVDNMKSFVPKLVSVVNYINATVTPSPNFFRRSVLHTILWYIDGKRDNKSYYLLDGAVNWVLKRLSELYSKGGQALALETELKNVAYFIGNLRDELDANAQVYVKSIAAIDKLSDDICKNIEEIRVIAGNLAGGFGKSTLLEDANRLTVLVKSISV